MNEAHKDTLSAWGEDAVISRLVDCLGPASVPLGPGDDCAIVEGVKDTEDWLLTSDPVLEGVHFLPDADPELIGHKAVGRVLSDIAAMGGVPAWLLINVTAPAEYSLQRLEAVYRGAQALCRAFDVEIVGGDVGQGQGVALHVFGIGRLPSNTAIRRTGAAAGDALYVTGELGGSGGGRHLSFEPRVREGVWLREHGWPTAMMDVSDGLSADLRRLSAASQVGLAVQGDSIPIAPAAKRMPDKRTPLMHALSDGEDFELVFTVPSDSQRAFEAQWTATFPLACTCIGRVTARQNRITLCDENGREWEWTEAGFEHFVSKSADQ